MSNKRTTTSRHLAAARLHGTQSKTTGEVRPGMSDWHVANGALVHQCAGALAVHRGEQPGVIAQRATEWVNLAARETRVFGNPRQGSRPDHLPRLRLPAPARARHRRRVPRRRDPVRRRSGRSGLVRPWRGRGHRRVEDDAWVRLNVDAAMLAQPQRYRQFGVQRWGAEFSGVRFLPLRNPGEARFISADGMGPPARRVRRRAPSRTWAASNSMRRPTIVPPPTSVCTAGLDVASEHKAKGRATIWSPAPSSSSRSLVTKY
jgi:hypothetical protein